MATSDGEVLKIRVDGIRLKELLSDDFTEKFTEEMDMDLKVATMAFIGENGVIIADHDNKEMEESAILTIESNSEDNLDSFKDVLGSLEG